MTTAVLVMAYGSPRSLDEVAPYFKDIRGGRDPSPEAVAELTSRYEAIGGPSGLNEISVKQAGSLGQELERREPGRFQVFVGMKHWHPFIAETVADIADKDIDRIVGVVLAPHYSAKSIGEYEHRIVSALEGLGSKAELQMVSSWYDQPAFVGLVGWNLRSALQGWDTQDATTHVFFTAHSIPERIVKAGDPYAQQLAASAKLYAEEGGASNWSVGWQSASPTGEPWIGPDILELLDDFAARGGRRALVAPVGFVSDHLEVLYDVDIECAQKARELGIGFRRIASPNDDPRLAEALADAVLEAAGR